MSTAIVLERISKSFRTGIRRNERVAVRSVSFRVDEGQVFGFIGPNGAGKSTTIKIMIGALRPDHGRAELFGIDVSDSRSRVGLGFVPENPSLHDYLTPMEVLRMGLTLHGVKTASPDAHCQHWLERFGLGAVSRVRINQFSKGMVQRTALAHALAIRPKLLILDEPLSGLDPIGRKEVVDVLAEYKKQGGTIFLTSHVLHDVERLADVFGLINKGEMSAVQTPAELVGKEDRVIVRTLGRGRFDLPMNDDGSGRWSCEIARSRLWDLLDAAKTAGHEVIEIKPALSLETAFLAAVSAGATGQERGEGGSA